ncbi:MAG: cysteine synthase A [Erysipelotrichaceae bacterium]|nr:MAG: cysteine synthase [Erysipelotrichaceae bacterium]TXT19900.1 MAG: cysteine synthase A [Erysipelotrichaceae bacterium]
MTKVTHNMTELIGNTPLVRLHRFEKLHGLDVQLYGKIEGLNPAGSVKDRIALAMITTAEKSGQLKPDSVIIEPTSGNTGIGLAAIAASKGYRIILTMPETMSIERRKLLKAYGAEVILTEGAKGMKGSIAKAEELLAETPNAFMPSQFENPANPAVHFATTGPEIYDALDGRIDILVAGIGTGGTISGAGAYLKDKLPTVKVIASEPFDSPMLSEGRTGPHKIAGWGPGFVPNTLNTSIYDEVLTVTTQQAFDRARELAKNEGILVGISSGAALHSALEVSKRPENKGKSIVVIFPDGGERYLSTLLYETE